MVEAGGRHFVGRFRKLWGDHGLTPCIAYGVSVAHKAYPRTLGPARAEELESALAAVRAYPGHAELVLQAVASYERLDRRREALDLLRTSATQSAHVIQAQFLEAQLNVRLAASGDTLTATAHYRRGLAAARRDGRPGVLYEFLLLRHGVVPGVGEEQRKERAALARQSGWPPLLVYEEILPVAGLIESGRIAEALAVLEAQRAVVGSHDVPSLKMVYHRLFGRALVRAGRPRQALPFLDSARRAAVIVENAQHIAEADHQIGHAYEGLGDWTSAAAAMDRFIVSASRTGDPGVRVISYHDAAAIRWKAGWNAGADSLSRLMVREIERERTHYSFAAEYYERIGDFGNAMRYLNAARGGASGAITDANVYFAALTRLNLALGNLDSAQAAAASHDSIAWINDDILLPRVLARRGRPAEAVAGMRRWTSFQAARGNLRGQVRGLVTLAEVLLLSAPTEALAVAREAEDLAGAHHFALEALTAARLRGEASLALARPDALRLLTYARRLARDHPDVMQRLLAEIAVGNAQLAAGKAPDALAAFEQAVRLVVRTTASVAGDIDAARFRAARIAAFNGAVRAVAAKGEVDAADMLSWSERKKSASPEPLTVTAIQKRLSGSDALVDLLVVDSAAWATVVTRAAARTLRLPVSVHDLERMARSLTRPMRATRGGRVDLARAHFDDALALRLGQAVIAPIEPLLRGISRLVIVPDAPLHVIPFEALRVAGSSRSPATYAIDRWTISYALAPGRLSMPAPVAAASLLVIEGEAPGAATETSQLRQTWPGGVEVLDARSATETRVLERVAAHTLVHFATHAQSDERDPLASYLALRGDSARDGLLHYAEIGQLRRARTLVVLNACETSGGELLAGSGFMSLARAFLVSGASSVIATQWPVGTAAGDVSAALYRNIAAGAPLDVALREAKLLMRRTPATAHPFFWASHVLIMNKR